jgi:hypothetical protein
MLATLIGCVLGLAVVLPGAAIVANRVPVLAEPGPGPRLHAYLLRNVAELEPQPRFPELRAPSHPVAPEVLLARAAEAARALGWKEIRADERAGRLEAVVATRWLRFRDDVSVWVEPDGDGARLRARSASRVGRGDLGANLRHLLDLRDAVARRLSEGP